MADTPKSLATAVSVADADRQRAARTYIDAVSAADRTLTNEIATAQAKADRAKSDALAAYLSANASIGTAERDLVERIAKLPSAWLPAFPGDVPPGQIRWGSGGGNDAARVVAHEAAAGKPIGVWRLFYDMGKVASAITACSTAIAAGRLPWVSFKPGMSWADVAAGKLDAALRDLFLRLGALPGPVWFTLHHEPEGGNSTPGPDDPGGAAAWRKMQERARLVLDASGVKNVAFAPILMAWTWDPRSNRNPEDWFTAAAEWDFIGIDVYQNKVENGPPTELAMWLNTLSWAKAKGVRLAIGEWGNVGTDATAAAEMRRMYDHLITERVVGCAAFDTPTVSTATGVPWLLTGEPLAEFRRLVADARSVDVRELPAL